MSAALRKEVRRAARGDDNAAEAIFDRYHRRVYRYALARLGNTFDAEDVTAETFARMINDLDRLRWRGGRFEVRLFRVTADHARAENGVVDGGRPDELRVIDRLPDLERDVLLLRLAAGLSTRSVGRVLRLTPKTVRRVQFRSLGALTGEDEEAATKERERKLDDVLHTGNVTGDHVIDDRVDLARSFVTAFAAEVPDAHRERALFVEGVRARRRRRGATTFFGIAVPAMAAAALGAFLLAASLTAAPNDALYPVRKVLARAGLARTAADEIRAHTRRATTLLADATALVDDEPEAAERFALDALYRLAPARALLSEVAESERARLAAAIANLEEHAADIVGRSNYPAETPDEGG